MLPGLYELLRCNNRLAASAPVPFLRGLESSVGSFPDEISFELGQRLEQVEDQATARCRGVDAFGDRSKAYTLDPSSVTISIRCFTTGPGDRAQTVSVSPSRA